MTLPDGDELRPESEADDGDIELLFGHGGGWVSRVYTDPPLFRKRQNLGWIGLGVQPAPSSLANPVPSARLKVSEGESLMRIHFLIRRVQHPSGLSRWHFNSWMAELVNPPSSKVTTSHTRRSVRQEMGS
jgi:hypothetical protein